MRAFKLLSLAMWLAGALFISGCTSSQSGADRDFAMASASNPTACQSKWVAAGNNGAKADRYYQISC